MGEGGGYAPWEIAYVRGLPVLYCGLEARQDGVPGLRRRQGQDVDIPQVSEDVIGIVPEVVFAIEAREVPEATQPCSRSHSRQATVLGRGNASR